MLRFFPLLDQRVAVYPTLNQNIMCMVCLYFPVNLCRTLTVADDNSVLNILNKLYLIKINATIIFCLFSSKYIIIDLR